GRERNCHREPGPGAVGSLDDGQDPPAGPAPVAAERQDAHDSTAAAREERRGAAHRHVRRRTEDVGAQPPQLHRRRRLDRADPRRHRGAALGAGDSRAPPRVVTAAARVSFIVPAYNEGATIGDVLSRVDALDLDKQVVVIDDGSTDETPRVLDEWARRDGIQVIRQENRGKGAAIRAAIPLRDGDVAVIQDADMEYDPAEVPQLIEPILRGVADVVFGSRLSGGRPQRAYLFWHLVGNRFLSLLTNVLYNTTLSDM